MRQRFLGFTDSGLPARGEQPPAGSFARLPLEVAAERLTGVLREFRPQVIVTYDPSGGYPHPDHVRTHEVAVAAFEAAGEAGRFPASGRPWRPWRPFRRGRVLDRAGETYLSASEQLSLFTVGRPGRPGVPLPGPALVRGK